MSTASLAFSGAGPIAASTKERVLAAAESLGYCGPNPLGRSLRSGRSGIVGVVVGDQLRRSFRDPVAIQMLDGLVGTLGTMGLGVLLIPASADPDGTRSVDPLTETAAMDVAVMLWGVRSNDPAFAALRRRGIPLVVGDRSPVEGVPSVAIADRSGTATLIEHLRGLGHTRIASVTLPLDDRRRCGVVDPARMAQLDWAPTRNRLQGFLDGGAVPSVVVEASASLVEAGHEAGRIALDVAEPPTAVVAQSDLLAAGVLLAARELGLRVPQDVSVAGFDGLDLPWLSPDVLTTVAQPLPVKGATMARMVAELIAGEQPASVELPVELRIGTTTGPARA